MPLSAGSAPAALAGAEALDDARPQPTGLSVARRRPLAAIAVLPPLRRSDRYHRELPQRLYPLLGLESITKRTCQMLAATHPESFLLALVRKIKSQSNT